MQLVLYKIVNRQLSYVKKVNVPDGTVDFDSWLKSNGYDSSYTLRRGIVQEVSAQEARRLQREHDRLKAQGKLPSVLERVVEKLSQNNR